ncbi:protein AKNAD1 isoform X2 [Oxyura jamaicensis]|uniref:protein AKNAD1 isoform X2 n=1 Tax=Oxyura jamaicensis TaxID=8884 RepID=UPI0015A633DD|nr:protein AKNAD1 isoform X2 [Oxyura jamaicensis]
MPASEASFKKEVPGSGFGKADGKEHLTNSKMSNVLLRHFPEGELLNTCQLIECETIPETSCTESIGETMTKPETYEHGKGPATPEQWAMKLEEYHLEKHEDLCTGGKSVLNENQFVSKRSISSTVTCGCRHDNSQLSNEYEDTHISHNTKEQRELFRKTVSSHRLIHGQSEVHHCLPDFSKVISKLQVPNINEDIKPVPTIEPTKSFPMLLSQSVTVDNILDNNCFHSVEVEDPEEMRIAELLQQLKILPQSDFATPSFVMYSGGAGTSAEVFTTRAPNATQATQDLPDPRLPHGTMVSAFPAAGTVQVHCPSPSHLLPELTQGEKMSQILKEQTDQLKIKVEDFTKHMTHDTFVSQDNYLALNQLKKYLDALERSYLTAREEHRVLQLQNYKDKSIHVGEFDPERKVEGEIFRLGMLLEDIQEQTDDCKYSLAPSLISDESARSSDLLWESPVVSSITDPPEETTFLHKNNKGENTSQTSDVIPQTNHLFSSKAEKCHLCPHTLQKRAESTSGRETEPLGKGYLLASKHSSSVMAVTQKTSQPVILMVHKVRNLWNVRLKGTKHSIQDYIKIKKDLCSDALEKAVINSNTGITNRLFSLVPCVEIKILAQPKRISTQKTRIKKWPRELVNRLSERNVNVKKPARNKPAIIIRNRNTNDFNANILNSTLDHAIQTANSLKRATERMVQAISEDLDKVARKQL